MILYLIYFLPPLLDLDEIRNTALFVILTIRVAIDLCMEFQVIEKI